MPEKVVLLSDGKNYRLETKLAKNEPHQGEYPCKIFISSEDRGNKIVSLTQPQDYDGIFENLGIILKGENFEKRMYELATEAGKNYADHLKCSFEDNSSFVQTQPCIQSRFFWHLGEEGKHSLDY